MTRTGQLELEYGTQAALDRAGEEWVTEARRKMRLFVEHGVAFSAEDVVAAVGLPPGESHNAVGAVVRQAAREGWIEVAGHRSSTRPDRHGGVVKVWQGRR